MRFLSVLILAILTIISLRGETIDVPLQGMVRDTSVMVKTEGIEYDGLLMRLRGASLGDHATFTFKLSGVNHAVEVKCSTSVDNKFSTYQAEKAEVEIERDGRRVSKTDVSSNFSSYKGEYNTIAIKVNDGGKLSVSGGSRVSKQIVTMDSLGFDVESITVTISGKMDVAEATIETLPKASGKLLTGWTMEEIAERISTSKDPLEGFWSYLDRENDRRYARPGGEYRLAVVKSDAGTYDIIYVGGAETNRARWTPGMLKGRLRVTAFADNYDLEWYDAGMEERGREAYATLTSPAILTLYFPLLKTQLRFSKNQVKAAL